MNVNMEKMCLTFSLCHVCVSCKRDRGEYTNTHSETHYTIHTHTCACTCFARSSRRLWTGGLSWSQRCRCALLLLEFGNFQSANPIELFTLEFRHLRLEPDIVNDTGLFGIFFTEALVDVRGDALRFRNTSGARMQWTNDRQRRVLQSEHTREDASTWVGRSIGRVSICTYRNFGARLGTFYASFLPLSFYVCA